ncbi:oxidoreductase [Granulicella sp. dw_53]|uniref:oxidoreductase n=1 Tax=Granulicella sp. dw_53 TaxID=2719792 RepID=UPI001BD5C92C|nr:oxidoreductase [Granulicella sp. dw_53]
MAWTSDRIESQRGRRAIVTGGNGGVGWHTALELARAGAEVTLAVRSVSRGEEAVSRIRAKLPHARVRMALLDLANLQSIREFALRMGDEPLDLLVNNAGIMGLPRRHRTLDGFEAQFGINYLGHFALTALLMPAILEAPSARVVTLSSTASKLGSVEFDNLQAERRYHPMGAYNRSKLAALMFALELQRRLSTAGLNAMSTAAHPGYAPSDLQKIVPGLTKFLLAMMKPTISHNVSRGALPILFAAVAREAEPGGYYGPRGLFEMSGPPVPVPIPEKARDTAVAKKLWEESERLTNIPFEVAAPSPLELAKRA